jgi:hypothetical protein
MAAKNWSDFPVSWPPKRGFDNRLLELDEVTHIAHVLDSIRIIEDRLIRSSLVYDESCLNTKRTHVSWVSPKTWANGYLYGNVAFIFDWRALVKKQKVYWVEHQRTSNQDICRFLICKGKFTDPPLREYDYTKPHGPLFYDAAADKWYHNNRVTSEYMILDDLPLVQCEGIRFVKHHNMYCNKRRTSCPDLGRTDFDAGAEVICKIVGTGQAHGGKFFEWRCHPSKIDPSVENAISKMYRRIVNKFDPARTGTLPASDQPEIMTAIMLASGWNQEARVAALLALFPDKASVESLFYDCLDKFFTGLKVSRD